MRGVADSDRRYRHVVFVNVRAIIHRDRGGVAEVYLQYREKPGESRVLELPGGRVEEFESITAALRREVHEETGMVLSAIEPTPNGVVAETSATEVECLPVYAAYQTMRGPIDSIGFYFLCTAEGNAAGSDESGRGAWFTLDDIERLLDEAAEKVSWVDQSGLRFHLRACGHSR